MSLITVVELPEFTRRAKAVMPDTEKAELIAFVAANPLAGVALGGGIRKFRFARPGAGKSGGYRAVHYYSAESGGPIFLLTLFAKNEKANLSPKEAAALVKLGEQIAEAYGNK